MEGFRPGMARIFFDQWFVAINADGRLPRVHDKKLSILALCALLEMAPATIPEALQDGWPGIVGGILKIFKGLPKAIEGRHHGLSVPGISHTGHLDRKALEEALQEESDDDDIGGEELLNLNEDDGEAL